MLLRCSICKGQFEIEPSPHKDTVFCSHCGAPLDMKPKSKKPAASTANSSSLLALAGELPPSQSQQPQGHGLIAQQSPQQRTSQSQGEYAFSSRPASPGAPPPSQPISDDPLASLASATQAPHATTVGVRKKLRKKDNSATAVLVIVGTILICVVILAIVLILHYTNQPAEAPLPAAPKHQPGEMFPNVPNQ